MGVKIYDHDMFPFYSLVRIIINQEKSLVKLTICSGCDKVRTV